jgi:hypothetical protein
MKAIKIILFFISVIAFAVCASAQDVQFSNELKGFEFFGKGKLKDLKLTVSSKDDVNKIFGKTCEKMCEYDSDWTIRFEYYEDRWIKEDRNGKGEKLRYTLDPKYLGKLRLIEMRPKKEISFAGVSFPNTFEKLLSASTIDAASGNSKAVINNAFQHSDGLTYETYSQTNYDDIKSKKAKSYKSGDLVLIRYNIARELEKDLFVLQN